MEKKGEGKKKKKKKNDTDKRRNIGAQASGLISIFYKILYSIAYAIIGTRCNTLSHVARREKNMRVRGMYRIYY